MKPIKVKNVVDVDLNKSDLTYNMNIKKEMILRS